MKVILRNTSMVFEVESSLARDILEHYSNALSDAKRNAFSTFIGTLENNGIYNNVTHMFLPLLSANVAECLWDAKTSNQLSSTEQLLFADGELYTVAGVSGVSTKVVVESTGGNFDSHIGYRLTALNAAYLPGLFKGVICCQPIYSQHKISYYTESDSSHIITGNDAVYDTNSHVVTTKVTATASQAITSDNLKTIIDGDPVTLTIPEGSVYSTKAGFLFANCEQYFSYEKVRVRIVILTQNLTMEKATILNNAITTLMNAFFS